MTKVGKSPEPSNTPVVQVEDFPICSKCQKQVDQVRWLDYQEVRLVFHTGCGGVLGVTPIKKGKKS